MKRRGWIIFSFVFCVAAWAEPLHVLFVGNSYTFVHRMPEILKIMAESNGHKLVYEQQTPGGRTFQQHWEEGTAVQKIKTGRFDVVVLQDQSFEPVIDPENMMKYGTLLAAEADKVGARKIYYLTPAYSGEVRWMQKDTEEARQGKKLFPEMLERLVASYSMLARKTNGDLAPVGEAWEQASEALPELQFHAADHSHAAPIGAYLTALVFYATIYHEAPSNMPLKLTLPAYKKGKPPTVIELDDATRSLLESIAWEVCQPKDTPKM